ncbi:MAG: amino acid ABC transporter permease [Candidatus Methylacidiphilales bacterium]|nr:amino acid ABC transporter permease [Candidatus Methylacidiphilales bacterium]
MKKVTGESSVWVHAVSFAAAVVFLALLLGWSFQQGNHEWNWAALAPYWPKFVRGWWVTLGVSAAAMVCSVAVGLLAALARRQPFLPLRYLSLIYTEVIRGTPLLVQILIFYYVIADSFGLENRYVAGVLILSLFSGAYLAEIFRSGIESVPASQIESARAIGLGPWQIYRLVIFPQALRQSLPPLAGQFASLVKDSSLLYVISIQELTLSAQEVNSFTYSTLESYIPLAVGYLLITLPLTAWTRSLEAKAAYET